MALPGSQESLSATSAKRKQKEIPLDYTINVMESDEFLHLLSEEESPEEQLKALHHCLEKLPEEQRTSITRFFLEEMSYADIVEQTGFTLNNVKSYIQNGKRNLKKLYQETGPMKLLDYIRGLRKGKEAHRLEKESMKDPFLPMLWTDMVKWREIMNNESGNCGCRSRLVPQRKGIFQRNRIRMLSLGALPPAW